VLWNSEAKIAISFSQRRFRRPRRKLTPIAPLIWRVGAPSIVEIEKLIGELQEAKSFLESEEERIQRELVRYIKLIQMASASIKIIFDTISGWHQAGHPMRKFVSPTDGSTGRDV
jgi:hypothetical protein